jgi:hypothetical protein
MGESAFVMAGGPAGVPEAPAAPSSDDEAAAAARPTPARLWRLYIYPVELYTGLRAPIGNRGIVREFYGKPGPTFKNQPFPSGARYLGGVRLLGVTCGPGVDPSMPIHRDPPRLGGASGPLRRCLYGGGGDVVEDLQSPAELRRAVRRADSAGRVTCWT